MVGFTLLFEDLESPALPPDQQQWVASTEEFMPTVTMWFARGVGIVQVDATLGNDEASMKLTGCTG